MEPAPDDPNASRGWQPVSDRKLRVGIVGYGVCRFGAAFSFQDHPNVTVAAVSDLFRDRCAAALAQACRCDTTYPSLEELVKDDLRRLAITKICTPPQWYPTHSNAYHIGVIGGSFTEVSCMGIPSLTPRLQAENNRYKNPFDFHQSSANHPRRFSCE